MKRPPLTEPTTIRVTEAQKTAIELTAKDFGHSKTADAYRHVLDLGFRWLSGERPAGYTETAPDPEIERLSQENAELRSRLAAIDAALRHGPAHSPHTPAHPDTNQASGAPGKRAGKAR